jgi:hypothetical protein
VADRMNALVAALSSLTKNRGDEMVIASAIAALDDKYDLSRKMDREPGLEEIIEQLAGRIYRALNTFSRLRGKRILDIASGSNTSRAPSSVHVNTPFGEQRIRFPSPGGYTTQFEPWFCRLLLELGAHPVGIDLGDLDRETFEHYHVDLSLPGALDFLPDHSFDAVHDSRLFGSPEFTEQTRDRADRLKIAQEIRRQEKRLLKADGIVIHSDAGDLTQ